MEMCSVHNQPITLKAGYGDFCHECIEEQGMTDLQRIEIRLKRIEAQLLLRRYDEN